MNYHAFSTLPLPTLVPSSPGWERSGWMGQPPPRGVAGSRTWERADSGVDVRVCIAGWARAVMYQIPAENAILLDTVRTRSVRYERRRS